MGFRSISTFAYDMHHLCMGSSFRADKPLYIDLISITTGHVTHYELGPQKGVHIMNTFERINEAGQLEVRTDQIRKYYSLIG